jgi:hypothetical protein
MGAFFTASANRLSIYPADAPEMDRAVPANGRWPVDTPFSFNR